VTAALPWSAVCITQEREEQVANQKEKEDAMKTKTNLKAGMKMGL
jgi:hypothetical protein